MKGRYAVYVVDLAGNSWPVLHTDDPVEALCRYYTERNSKKHGACGIWDDENPESGCVVSRIEEDEATNCTRWGSGPDRCVKPFDHIGVCVDAQGSSTLTLAAELLAKKVATR